MEIHNSPPYLVAAQLREHGIGRSYVYLMSFTEDKGPVWCESLKTAKIYDSIEDFVGVRQAITDFWHNDGTNTSLQLCNLSPIHKTTHNMSVAVLKLDQF